MKNQVVLMVFMFISVVCAGQKMSRQVYVLSDHVKKENCEVDTPCDCCASDLIFLNKKNFALVDRCLNNESYLKGKYVLKNKILTLDFNQAVVSNNYNESTNRDQYEKQVIQMDPLKLSLSTCGQDKYLLGHSTIKEYKYGSRRQRSDEKLIIRQLKKHQAWKMFDLKKTT